MVVVAVVAVLIVRAGVWADFTVIVLAMRAYFILIWSFINSINYSETLSFLVAAFLTPAEKNKAVLPTSQSPSGTSPSASSIDS